MIRTRDLENFMYYELLHTPFGRTLERGYIHEIVARLKSYDKLIESIEKLCRNLSKDCPPSSKVDNEPPWDWCHGHPDNPPIDSEDK